MEEIKKQQNIFFILKNFNNFKILEKSKLHYKVKQTV